MARLRSEAGRPIGAGSLPPRTDGPAAAGRRGGVSVRRSALARLSVRWRLTLWYGAGLTLIIAAFSGCVFWAMGRHLAARTDFELEEELAELALEVGLAESDRDLEAQLRRRFFRHADFDFQVTPRGGVPIFRSERLSETMLPPLGGGGGASGGASGDAFRSVSVPGRGEMRVAERTVARAGERLAVEAAMPLAPARAVLSDLLAVLLTAGPLAVLAAVGGGYFLARKSLAPVARMTALAEDITAQRLDRRIEGDESEDEFGQLARTLNAMMDRIETGFEQMRLLTADAAHELRTPLAVLCTEAEIALKKPRSPDEYRHVLDVILDQARDLARLSDQLLNLSRQESGLTTRRVDEVPFDALLHDVVDRLRPAAAKRGLDMRLDTPEDVGVWGDDVELSRLLYNLIENAIKFTRPGGRIDVSATAAGSRVSLEVRDTGVGIPAEDLPHVFRRFYRIDKSRNARTGGAGLGLALAKAIVEAHYGTIEIESTPGAGTAVRVRLPLVELPRPSLRR